MGLDISIKVDHHNKELANQINYRSRNGWLSRGFCWLMCRKDTAECEPELDQISKIAGVDVTPIKQMELWGGEHENDLYLDGIDDEARREEVNKQNQASRMLIQNNITLVSDTVSQLIDKLNKVKDLGRRLGYNDDDWTYFSNFNSDSGDGYIGNNLGQDLRKILAFTEHAKAMGANTVYFEYG